MAMIDGTFTATSSSPTHMNDADKARVVEILGADNLRLAEARLAEPYGRAQLGTATRILMWAMRIYVVLSLILIVAQIYISLKPH
jgi:hypothetical protein